MTDDDIDIKRSFTGSKFRIVHCEGARESFEDALMHIGAKKNRQKFKRAMILQTQRLADGKRMTKDNFPQEGNLPKKAGQTRPKKFNALKKIPIRGYCWFSDRFRNTYFISHYVYKDFRKLKKRDSSIIGANWRRVEENGDEF